jgi:hypothetical protein
MDDKALRNARKNLIGGAILLPLSLIIQVYGLVSQGRVSLLWVLITVACVLYMMRSYQLVKAAKARAARPPGSQPTNVQNNFSWPPKN